MSRLLILAGIALLSGCTDTDTAQAPVLPAGETVCPATSPPMGLFQIKCYLHPNGSLQSVIFF